MVLIIGWKEKGNGQEARKGDGGALLKRGTAQPLDTLAQSGVQFVKVT
jgi:hypothetical protein